eukprot:scaffold5479_cov199-Amphora_coffeaeformis.AAC.100
MTRTDSNIDTNYDDSCLDYDVGPFPTTDLSFAKQLLTEHHHHESTTSPPPPQSPSSSSALTVTTKKKMNQPNNTATTTAKTATTDNHHYAHPHIPSFLALPTMELDDPRGIVQIIPRGEDLTAHNFRHGLLSIDRPLLVTDTPESIGMKVPPDGFTIRNVAEMVGGAYPVHVLDVHLQTEMEGWTINDLVEYFEDPRRKHWNQANHNNNTNRMTETTSSPPSSSPPSSSKARRPRRAAALQSEAAMTRPPVLNQLSLEISRTTMGPPFVQSPQFVRDMDWITLAWPESWRRQNKYPMVQQYCLTSAAGAWTDFHIDFGGTSVWYHVLSGAKEFCLIAPTATNLQVYQAWLCSKHQDADFLPDNLPPHCRSEVYKIRLEPHQTLIIPSGWIHAVYTPEDSLVLGGNFVHGLAIQSQFQAHTIETVSHIPNEMLFPYYRQLHVCAVGYYYSQLLEPGSLVVPKEKEGFSLLLDQVERWVYQDDGKPSQDEEPSVQTLAKEIARKHNFLSFGAFLDDFRRLLEVPVTVVVTSTTTTTSSPAQAASASDERNKMPRIRIRTAFQSSRHPLDDEEAIEKEPRIRLSQPQRALPMPANLVAPRKREDVSSFVGAQSNDDEEWTPSSSSSPARASSPKRSHAKRSRGEGKKASSSRLRLLKKLK